jgi:hypothetical protein
MSTTVSIKPGRYSAGSLLNALGIPPYDYISLTYSGTLVSQAVFKDGGVSGVTVGTLAFTYNGNGDVLTVTRT